MNNKLYPLGDIRSKEPIKVNGFDVETTGKNNDFLMGSIFGDSAIGGKEVYWNQRRMQNALLSKRFRAGYIYAHNLQFDLFATFPEMPEGFEAFHNGSSLIYAKYRDNNDHTWEFRDTGNIYPWFSVEDLGEVVDLPKLEMDFDRISSMDKEKVEEYNIRDSRICYEFVKFVDKTLRELGGKLEITAAKTALNFFRRNYQSKPWNQPTKDIVDKMYRGYYGGRTSPFVKGKVEDVYVYDIASLYPYVMSKIEFPDPDSIRITRNEREIRRNLDRYEGMSLVTVKAPEINKPILPYRTEDKLLFPTGEFTSWQTHNELEFARDNGYVVKNVHTQIYSEESFKPFEEYVQDLYNLRMEWRDDGNSAEVIAKLLMNSLYGKFGQKVESDGGFYRPIEDYKAKDLVGKETINGYVLEKPEPKLFNHIQPLLASYVTSAGRIELYKWINKSNALYCDTDSVMTTKKLGVSDEKVLGEMDFEGHFDAIYIFGPKFYILENSEGVKIKCKGVPFDARENLWNNIQTGQPEVEYEKFMTMREGIRRGIDVNKIVDKQKELSVISETKRKFVDKPTHSDQLLEGSFMTEPIRVAPELEEKAAIKPEIRGE